MAPETSHKADELIRLLGQIGQAQEHGVDAEDLFDRAVRLHDELAQDLPPQRA